MAIGLLVVVILFAVVPLALLVVALVDIVNRPADLWERSGQSQVVWVLIVVLVGLIGPILYLTIAKPRLAAAV